MNILFLYEEAINPLTGGAERITFLLANYFESKGFKVLFLGLTNHHSIEDNRQYFLPDSTSFTSEINVNFYNSFLLNQSIDLVINKGGTNPEISKLSYNCKKNGIKLISVIHNSVLGGIKNFSSAHKSRFVKKGLGWLLPLTDISLVKSLLLYVYKLKYGKHYESLCKESDYVILESVKFKEELIFLLNGQSFDNIRGIPNFILCENYISINKHKEILYVGRINTSQKRVDLLLKIWSLLHEQFPDWTLKIVGGGEELESIKILSSQLNLKNIIFYGYQNAKPHYESASIICLTSSYEGFGLTLIEAMQYGVVPFSFNSYLSVTDIIDNKVNGCLITPFDIKEYANTLSNLMSSQNELDCYSSAAIKKAKQFDINVIGVKWLNLFEELNNKQ